MKRYWFGAALFFFASRSLPARNRIRSSARSRQCQARTCGSASTPAFGRIAHRVRCRQFGSRIAPAHGVVSVKRAMLKATNVKQCLAIDVPAFVAFYRAAQDFSGADQFELEVTFSGGRKEIQNFRVSVAGANGGQGI